MGRMQVSFNEIMGLTFCPVDPADVEALGRIVADLHEVSLRLTAKDGTTFTFEPNAEPKHVV